MSIAHYSQIGNNLNTFSRQMDKLNVSIPWDTTQNKRNKSINTGNNIDEYQNILNKEEARSPPSPHDKRVV